MLYRFPYVGEEQFPKYLQYIKTAFYPEERYKRGKDSNGIEFKKYLPDWKAEELPSPVGMINECKKDLKKITNSINRDENFYAVLENKKTPKSFSLPFIDRYHQFFLERKWYVPYRDPRKNTEHLFSLFSPDKKNDSAERMRNFSANEGNYNHFVNVVSAMARLLNYLSNKKNVRSLLDIEKTSAEENNGLAEFISFAAEKSSSGGLRTFRLMMGAFFHDIGKTIVNHRHGMEGANILADNPSRALYKIEKIVKAYDTVHKFTRDDFLFISDLLLYHDQFGTLSTGESGFLRLVDVVNRIKRYRRDDEGKRCLVDLWLLNVVDIMVSLEDKWKPQYESKWKSKESSEKAIKSFLGNRKAKDLLHDLKIAMEIFDERGDTRHETARYHSNDHAVERIRRLVCESLFIEIEKDERKEEEQKKGDVKKFKKHPLMDTIKIILEQNDTVRSIISRAIKANVDLYVFCEQLSWIGQMDYSLGFFNEIAKSALEYVKKELESDDENREPTRWIRYAKPGTEDPFDEEYSNRNNALLFMDNYIATVIQILRHLLFREPSIKRLRNIEFIEAKERLTDEKLLRIIFQEGPYRASRSIELVLQTVFIY